MPDDPYRFGFCAPSDFNPEPPPDEFKRCRECGGWYDDPHPHERPMPPAATVPQRPYDPELDGPF